MATPSVLSVQSCISAHRVWAVLPVLRGVARILHWEALKLSAEGARIEAPKEPRGVGIGEGCPPPQPTRGSGERRELSQRGPGRSPGRQCIFGIFEVHRTFLVERKVPTKPVLSVKNPLSRRLGACPPPLNTLLLCFYVLWRPVKENGISVLLPRPHQGWHGGAIGRASDLRLWTYRSRVRVLPRNHCAVALGKLLTTVCLCQAVCIRYNMVYSGL